MIAENAYLIPEGTKKRYSELNRYIVVVTDLDAELNSERDLIKEKIDKIKKVGVTLNTFAKQVRLL